MASGELDFQTIFQYFKENGGKVKNREAVRYFRKYLTDPVNKDENRRKFKDYVNTIAHTKNEGDEKVLILKTKYLNDPPTPSNISASTTSLNMSAAQVDPRNNIGLPLSPIHNNSFGYSQQFGSTTSLTSPRQPPPYRPPPPVMSPSPSLDSISMSSSSTIEDRPVVPPRAHRSNSRGSLLDEPKTPEPEKGILSVKERTQQFNRLASFEDDLSPKVSKSAEKDRSKNWGQDDSDVSSLTPLEPKKCQEWYVTASRGDYQELLKLAKDEPRLVNKKDPFSTVLHWGAKHGNADIIKIFAGKYKVDVNGKTNGGSTPLHISAQFHQTEIFKLLIEVYKADTKIRDYSGRTPEYYLLAKEQKENKTVTLRKIKSRKKQADKDLGFLRIGSLNVRVKKTTEAFSNFLGVGSGPAVAPAEADKMHKGWGSADNVNKDFAVPAPKSAKKRSKRGIDYGQSSTPSTPKTPVKNFSTNSLPLSQTNDSDSDGAAGFDSHWKN